MRRFLILVCLPLMALADSRWSQFSTGPFELLTDAGARSGRETLVRFEEFRHALAQIIGERELQTPQRIRILLFRNAKEAAQYPASQPILAGRDRYAILLVDDQPVPPTVFREATRLFLETNTARMPAHMERGLEDLFSTIEVSGIHITLGKPLPAAARNRDWARMHLLAVDPQYYGRLRVLLYNLRQGVDQAAAFRNAFGKSPEEIEKETEQHLATGNFQTVEVSSEPLSVQRDFPEKPVEPEDLRLSLADLLLPASSPAVYEALIQDHAHSAEAHEGLALLALRNEQQVTARKEFAEAIDAGSQSARCYLEYARLEEDASKAMPALKKAAELNPKLAEPYFLMATHEEDSARRIADLKKAADLAPRRLDYWKALAEAYLAAKDFSGAAQAWTSAAQAAPDPAERQRMQQARLAIEQQRLDYEAAERKRIADENQRELDKLKQQARAELHALEARVNNGESAVNPGEKVVPWWNGPKPSGRVQGALTRVDCLKGRIRLVVNSDSGGPVKLLVRDPSLITILGGGEATLNCGAQKNRRVVIEYFPKKDPALATTGEVATIQFQ